MLRSVDLPRGCTVFSSEFRPLFCVKPEKLQKELAVKSIASFLLPLVLLPSAVQAQSGGSLTVDQLTITGPGSTGDVSGMSVATRTLAARAQDEINAFDNGVVCDGVTDNAGAFAVIRTKLTAGKALYFPPAAQPCMTSAPLIVEASNVAIRAAPGTVTLKPLPTNTASVQLLAFGFNRDVLVYGLTFDGGGQDFGLPAKPAPTTQAYSGDNVVFDTVTIQNTPGIAINYSIMKFSGARNSTFRNIGNRWKTTNSKDDRYQAMAWSCFQCAPELVATLAGNFARDNVISDIGLDPISFGDAVNVSAVGNRCEMTNDQVAQIAADAYAGCIYTTKVTGATITGNYAVGATGNAIDIHLTTGYTVSGNYIEGSGQAGIGAFSSYGSVSGNTILNSGYVPNSPYSAGISLGGPVSGVSIQGNLIADTRPTKAQPFGIQGSNGSCTGCTIANNTIFGMANAEYGGYLTGPTALTAQAGGTGLTGAAWASWTPTFTATGGTGVTFPLVSATYEQTGKTVRGRVTLALNDTGTRPSAFTFTLPGGKTVAQGGAVGSGSNVSTGQSVQVVSTPSGTMTVQPLTPGGPFLSASGQFFVISFEAEVQ